MKKEITIRFKILFEEQRKKLLASHELVSEEFQLKAEDFADEVDLTSSEMEQGMRMRLRNRETLFLKKIDEALRRIEGGVFGVCEDCEGEIDERRLEARPTATLCVTCKENEERREHFHIDGQRSKSLGKVLRLRFA